MDLVVYIIVCTEIITHVVLSMRTWWKTRHVWRLVLWFSKKNTNHATGLLPGAAQLPGWTMVPVRSPGIDVLLFWSNHLNKSIVKVQVIVLCFTPASPI